MYNKVLIICFDGLDIVPVEKYNLENLKQVEYGTLRGPSVFSGGLWSTFLTGLSIREHGITGWKNDALNTESYFRTKKGMETIPDLFKKPKVLYFPFHDPKWTIYYGIEHDYFKIFEVNTKVFLKVLEECQKKDWDLILTCFMIIDNLSHYGKLEESSYYLINYWVKILKEVAKPDWLLIIGDKDPNHKLPGFYSSSIQLNLNDPSIGDFFKIIREKVREC